MGCIPQGEENDMSTLLRSVLEDEELSCQDLEIEMDHKAYDLDMDEVIGDIHFPNIHFEAFNRTKKRPFEMSPVLEQSVKNVEVVNISENKKQKKERYFDRKCNCHSSSCT